MRHDRHNNRKHNNNNWKNNRHSQDNYSPRSVRPLFRPTIKAVTEEQIKETEEAIRSFKDANQPVCPLCGEAIRELSTALNDSKTGQAIHFDCAIEQLQKDISLEQGEKIAYIGQGRFAVLYYANVHDVKHFQIRKVIDYEEKDKQPEWRGQMSELFSKVH
ncbi:MAG: hypothetical protein SPJ89_01680 [Treponema sp.]|nr:hypothetical protein [Spirochaetales bacterium]MDY5810666.1 hypothetical protein [Treponema sp.]